MQIEVGEYKTRCGGDVVVIAIVDSIVIGYFIDEGPESVTSWRADNGRHFVQTQRESAIDLIRKKPKRIKIDGWLRIYKRSDGSYYTSVFEPVKPSCKEAVAITKIVIDCEEGENLD